ncbi:peptidyl-prolyl cis-trans isomerase CYP59-like isoform X1 [Silene latifolia]|uniref:peptidyl-prolyl cis-trans isomerase CYP59-like isoform X1 n=1 Tax=Silene latifolia TaxID=37657 RepID=UPI003D7868CE
MVVTSLGDLVIDLFTDRCPFTCKNFLKLCKIKYYNGCLFHTVQKDFTAQTGDPTGSGSGGDSIYKFIYGDQARFFNDEVHSDLKHLKTGTVAMASAGENLNASQFYITLRDDLDYLDEKHTVFGEVAEGHETLMRINEAYVDDKGRPFKNIRIKHTYVLDDPFEDPSQLAELIPDASPEGKPKEEVFDEVRLEDDWVPMDSQLAPEELEEAIRTKEAHSRAVVLETIGDLPVADVKPPENVLFVCKLNPVTEDEDLHTIFSRFGTVTSAEVIRDYKTGDSLCYAFIEFEDKDACERAYFKMDNALIDDRRIYVDFSQSVSKLSNQFRRKGIQGKGCYKCGSLDHLAKDCADGSNTLPNQKYILKDDNKQRGGVKHADYEMVFDEGGSPRQERRHGDQGDKRSHKSGSNATADVKHRIYGSKELSHRHRRGDLDDKPRHDGKRDHRHFRKDHRSDGSDRHDRSDGNDRHDSKHSDQKNNWDYRETRDDNEHRKRSSDIDREDKKEGAGYRKRA